MRLPSVTPYGEVAGAGEETEGVDGWPPHCFLRVITLTPRVLPREARPVGIPNTAAFLATNDGAQLRCLNPRV